MNLLQMKKLLRPSPTYNIETWKLPCSSHKLTSLTMLTSLNMCSFSLNVSHRDITYDYAGRIHYPSYATTATILSTHKARWHGLDISIALKRPNMVAV